MWPSLGAKCLAVDSIRKSAGQRGLGSFMSEETYPSGLVLISPSTMTTNVESVSFVSLAPLAMPYNAHFTHLTIISANPLVCGAPGGENVHCTL